MKKSTYSSRLSALVVLAFAYMMLGIMPMAKADEGMWLPLLIKRLNQEDMKKMGLQLSAEEIYSVNNSSLKDAIVGLNAGNPQGNFCTGEVVSSQGLVLTNHHCAYDAIQSHSSIDKDYLTNGFWAKSFKEELPAKGVAASFVVRMEDVTAKIREAVEKAPEGEKKAAAAKISQALIAEAVKGTHYTAYIKDFLKGNEYYLFVVETFKDVRLVGAPPSAIGKFGGDTDNWMWPRQTGDFSMLRIYMGKDGKPADYSPDNVPYVPKHYLPISMSGVKPGDFTMVFGFPGRTDRYRTSYGIQMDIEQSNPARIKLRERRLALMKEDMDAADAIRIKYASKYASISNYYKYFIGQNQGLKRLRTLDYKKNEEQVFQAWAEANKSEQYSKVLPSLEALYKEIRPYNLFNVYRTEAGFAPEIMSVGANMMYVKNTIDGKTDAEKTAMMGEVSAELKEEFKSLFKDYNTATDKKIFTALLKMFYQDIPKDQHPAIFKTVETKYKGDFNKFADAVYSKSFLTSEEKVNAFLDKFDVKALEKDPGYQVVASIQDKWTKDLKAKHDELNGAIERNMKTYVAGLMEMRKDAKFYPDANSTLRLTYGKVQGYRPKDGVIYDHYTTLDGVIEKEDPNNEEFVVPGKLSELYRKREFGNYAENGTMKVAFITDNDITGGNSGSPVINGKGELVGIAFDGNWEAMTGDLVFDKDLKRCINVDIRYVLFIIDKYAGATNLINEMKLVTEKNGQTVPAKEGSK